jgi:hypothetical protein
MVNHAQLSPSTQGLLGSQSTEEEITLQYSNQIVAMIKSNRSHTILQHSLKIESHGPREKGRKERVHRKKKRGCTQAWPATIDDLGTNYSSTAPSGGLQAVDGGTHDDKNFEPQRVQDQWISISSLIRSVLYLDPSRSNSTSSSGKCDKTTVSASLAPTRPRCWPLH